MFQRFLDEGLAQHSFLIGCDRTKRAVVIDPRRDASVYIEAARQGGFTISDAIETHVHADFVSGARELAAAGARVLAGPGAALGFDHAECADGERLVMGDVALTFLHTPGHTFEHLSVLADGVNAPSRLFTGDLLFTGAVGRPDLAGAEQSRALAAALFTSVQRVLALDDAIEIHPGHGAGSLCGAGIAKEPSSTIGRERLQNPWLRLRDRDEFVARVLADLPETPPYFADMKRINQAGPPVRGLAAGLARVPAIRASATAALVADGALVIDVRAPERFGAGHVEGALNIGFGPRVGYWAGWVVPPDTPVILFTDAEPQIPDAAVQLLRVGVDRIEGVVSGGIEAWRAAGLPIASIDQIPAAALRRALVSPAGASDLLVVDVRSAAEWQAGHVEGTINIPVGGVAARAAALPRDRTIATICEGGTRSSLAASVLAREGVPRVANITGGFAAYRAVQAT